MAPLQQPESSSRFLNSPFYSSTTFSSSTSDLDLHFNNSCHSPSVFPRSLYGQSFDDRPTSSRSVPSAGRFRKNMKDITGYGPTEEEFDALPIAVRRKYFSTLERLRFASSRPNALHDLSNPRYRKPSLADRRGLSIPVIEPRRRIPRRLKKLARTQSISHDEASWFLTLPAKIKKKEFTREEQVILSGGRQRENVILDAADEAIYKASRRASRNLMPLNPTAPLTPSSTRSSVSRDRGDVEKSMAEAMYESFRWMDEEEDLDLKLVLDDYHANLDGVVIPTPESVRRPSFRRQMSITKMPFNRNSLSSIPSQSRSPKTPKLDPSHSRQKSRALSLIAPKHGAKESISSIDPNATHYQDPEARLKLRVYLASPQKFDEAIEFGFPSIDGVAEDKENKPPRLSRDIISRKSRSEEKAHSFFLNDIDMASLFEDDTSMMDPESPLTPMLEDSLYKPHHRPSTRAKDSKNSADFSHLGITKPVLVKQPESYTHAMAGSREMTLRMTLTRPDLRADENTLYGWQTTKSPLREESLIFPDPDEKSDIRGPFGGNDGWGPAEKDNGVVKRLWNKVRSSQRKSS